MKRVRAVVRGDVQGVGFRAATAHEARRAGVAGWVRNQRDGSVEVDVEGAADAVDALIKWLRRGPSLARVTAVEIDDSLPPAGQEGFTIRS
jgi:acylphosphatase